MNPAGIISPHIYLIFILLLPARINKSLLLFLAFGAGLTIDYFSNTLGLNAAACVAIAFIRPSIHTLLFRSHDFNIEEEPSPLIIGLGGFIKYTFLMVFAHFFIIIFLEMLSFNHLYTNVLNIITGSVFTTILIIIIVLFTTKKA